MKKKKVSAIDPLLHLLGFFSLFTILTSNRALCIRLPERISLEPKDQRANQPLKAAVFALGSFWRSEAVFGCLDGVVRTTVGYCGGSKSNPEFRSLADHAESVQIEYDPKLINFGQLLDVFWSSHDSRQVFGQGPDVGNQYRSIIFTNGTEEVKLAAASKEREQTRSRSSIVTTQIQKLGTFIPLSLSIRYSVVPEYYSFRQLIISQSNIRYDKFELKRNRFLLQLIGNLPEEELSISNLATKLNGYAAELCPRRTQGRINSKINDIIKKGWPILQEV